MMYERERETRKKRIYSPYGSYATTRAEALTQAVLARAFAGKL
jgi:hypothetical protein